MKILFVQDSLGTGGAERSNAELWYFLRSQGVEFKVVVLEHRKEGVEQEILSNGFDVTFLETKSALAHARKIAGIIKSYSPDIVQSVLYRSTFPVRIARHFHKFYHLESLVSCPYNSVRLQDKKVNKLGFRFYKELYKYTHPKGTDGFLAITEEVKNHYESHVKIPSSKITVIPRGRKDNEFIDKKSSVQKTLRQELNFNDSDLLFIHVGRQEFAKGHMDLLKAVEIADAELLKNNVKIILCGRKGNATAEIDNFLSGAKIQTEIKFLGHRHDIYRLLAGSDAFVFPSLYEGLGGSLLEAQAAALPILCSNIPVFKEVMKSKENVLMFEVGNPKDLSLQLKKMASSEKIRKELGEKSLSNFKQHFQIDEVHQKTFAHYKNIIKKHT